MFAVLALKLLAVSAVVAFEAPSVDFIDTMVNPTSLMADGCHLLVSWIAK